MKVWKAVCLSGAIALASLAGAAQATPPNPTVVARYYEEFWDITCGCMSGRIITVWSDGTTTSRYFRGGIDVA